MGVCMHACTGFVHVCALCVRVCVHLRIGTHVGVRMMCVGRCVYERETFANKIVIFYIIHVIMTCGEPW